MRLAFAVAPMQKSDFRFDFPEESVADYPVKNRKSSRLLQVSREGELTDRVFRDIGELTQAGDLLIVNNSRVIRARIPARKETGGRVEILVERLLDDHHALAMLRAAKPLREGAWLLAGAARMRVLECRGNLSLLALEGTGTFSRLLERTGEIPLPPYIRRAPEAIDEERYQTVYAKHPGSVAAPTAGLHFDGALLASLVEQGVDMAELTLHIGAGTFAPVRSEVIEDHVMHRERMLVDAALCSAIAACRQRGRRVIAVGTTVVRALETACGPSGEVLPYDGETDLFIRPGYRFRVPDVMITNFHLPETSLFILVCAFAGRQRMLDAYRHAIEKCYRFFSYGDAMWLERNDAVYS